MTVRSLARAMVLASTVGALLLHASPAGAGPWEYGFRAGLNSARLPGSFAAAAGFETRQGFTGGGFVAYDFAPSIGLEVGGFYCPKGAKTRTELTDGSGSVTGVLHSVFALDYLEIPVLVRIRFTSEHSWHPELRFGPTLAFKISSKITRDYFLFPTVQIGDAKSFDPGLQAGLGLVVGRGPLRGTIGASFTASLADAFDRDPSSLNGSNRTFSVVAGVSH